MSLEQDEPRAARASAHKPHLDTIKKRSDFLAVGKTGKKFSCSLFVVMAQPRPPASPSLMPLPPVPPDLLRVGYTVSKKVSKKAVTRNRIKRRLREAVRVEGPKHGQMGWDYVIIARRAAEQATFDQLTERLRFALKWLHRQTK